MRYVFVSLLGIAVGSAFVAFDETVRTMVRERLRRRTA
jgi:hypothetical protein